MIALKRLASNLGVAEIRIWNLIVKRKIKSKADLNNVYVDKREVELFIKHHPRLFELCQNAYRITQINYSRL